MSEIAISTVCPPEVSEDIEGPPELGPIGSAALEVAASLLSLAEPEMLQVR
jgi:hypothetical protein